MKYESLGCYKAVDDNNNNNMAMPELLINEISPASDKFDGYILEFDKSWETMYSQLLCRCARATEDKGYANFAIRNKGSIFILSIFGAAWLGLYVTYINAMPSRSRELRLILYLFQEIPRNSLQIEIEKYSRVR